MNTDAEQMLLSEVFVDNTVLEDIDIEPDDFYGIPEKLTFKAMRKIYSEGKVVDMVNTLKELQRSKDENAVGGGKYLLYIVEKAFTAVGAKDHANIIKEESLRRKVHRLLAESYQKLKDYENVDELISEIQDNLIGLSEKSVKKGACSAKEVAEQYAVMAKTRTSLVEKGINTGYGELDGMIRGLRKGTLTVLAARPSMGKTAFALNISQSVARKNKVLFFSLEMRNDELMQRIFNSEQSLRNISQDRIINDFDNVMDYMVKQVGGLGLWLCDNADVKVSDIRKCARQVRQKAGGLDLIVIDYLQLMVAQNKNVNRVQEVTELTRSLKVMARELDIPIIILSQLNRSVESRNDKRPLMSDLRESGSIEQDADIVMMLYREYVYNQQTEYPDLAELIVNKNRAGSIGTIYLNYNAEATLFRSIDPSVRQNLLHSEMLKQIKNTSYGDEEE